jgi:hypothetical protein
VAAKASLPAMPEDFSSPQQGALSEISFRIASHLLAILVMAGARPANDQVTFVPSVTIHNRVLRGTSAPIINTVESPIFMDVSQCRREKPSGGSALCSSATTRRIAQGLSYSS